MGLKRGKILNQYDFSGGINIADPGHLIADNECYARPSTYDGTRNLYWDKYLKRRSGTLKVNTDACGNKFVNGIRFYRPSSPTITTIAAADTGSAVKIYYLDGSSVWQEITGGTAIATGKKVYFAPWKEKLFVATGDTVIQVVSYSGGWSKADISGLTYKPQYICQHKDRLWAAGGDMPEGYMECCDYDDEGAWASTTGEAFNVGFKDGDPITQLLPRKDDLVVYKNDSIWVMQGDNLYNWFQHRQEDAVGCVAPLSAVEIGFGHIFLGGDNIYFFDGTNDPVAVGDKIIPWLDAIPLALRKLAAGCYFAGSYRLALASSAMTIYNDKELWLDLASFKTGKIAWWIMDGRNIAAYVPYNGPNDTNTIYMLDGAAGYLRKMDIGKQDDTVNIPYEFHSKYFVFEEPTLEKIYDRLKVDTPTGIGSMNLDIIKNLNDEYSLPFVLSLGGSGSTYGSAVLGTSLMTSLTNARMITEIPLPQGMDGYALSYWLRHSGNYDNVGLYGFSLSYKYKRF
jgi:hypothetical protein